MLHYLLKAAMIRWLALMVLGSLLHGSLAGVDGFRFSLTWCLFHSDGGFTFYLYFLKL